MQKYTPSYVALRKTTSDYKINRSVKAMSHDIENHT